MQLVQAFPQAAVAAHPPPQPRQLGQRRRRATAAVEQSVDFVHDRPQGPQLRFATRQTYQRGSLGFTQMMTHEQITLLEQLPDPPLDRQGSTPQALRWHGLLGASAG